MPRQSIAVSPREAFGRGANRRLRSSGSTPGVIYAGGESRPVTLDTKSFAKLWHQLADLTPLVTIEEGDNKVMALIQEVQRDALKDTFIHVDFFEVSEDHAVTTRVALHAAGEASGVKNEGGTLDFHLHDVEVRCLPKFLPDYIDVDVTELNIGNSIHVRDLPEVEGIAYTMHPETVVMSVVGQAREEEPEAVEGLPEVEEGEAEADMEGAAGFAVGAPGVDRAQG
ncbi:MAG: 50S ribosomal protein L25 [Opitutae bacterium]|nr:50S ribosomal protein L25 [Opitutae bacterium]MBC9888958.1 50S ribosomal protein L25 [Opitutae bacterium]